MFHRLPLGLKDQATFSVLWEVLKHLWNKRVPDALKLLLDFSWPGDNISLINAVVDAIRAAESRNISKLYRSVFLKDLERKLLLSNSDALLLCNQYGWSVDAAGAVSVTSVLSSEASRTSGETTLGTFILFVYLDYNPGKYKTKFTDSFNLLSGSHGLEELTRIVLFLEKEPLTASSAVSSAGSALATSASAGTASAITAAASQGMAVDH